MTITQTDFDNMVGFILEFGPKTALEIRQNIYARVENDDEEFMVLYRGSALRMIYNALYRMQIAGEVERVTLWTNEMAWQKK